MEEWIPLEGRIRKRLHREHATQEKLAQCLNHLFKQSGNPSLMRDTLKLTQCDHAIGKYRALIGMASELLSRAAEEELSGLVETFIFTLHDPTLAQSNT